MRIQTYLDESHSRHFDLVGGGDNPWSIDLVVESSFLHSAGWFYLRPRGHVHSLRFCAMCIH